MMPDRIRKVIRRGILLLFAGLLYAFLVQKLGYGIPCLFRLRTGLLCPACGITRMFLAIGRLDFQTAFYENPFMLLSLPFLLFCTGVQLVHYVRCGERTLVPVCRWVGIAFVAGAVVFGVLRNV